MPQSVFDVGDPITSRLKLGITPDGTTIASVVVRRPDGTALTGLILSAWQGDAGDERTVQWYATDDGQPPPSPATVGVADGDWLAVWTVTGKGASVTHKIYSVRALPSTSTRPTWMPFLSQVAKHVPWLTVDQVTVGADTYLGTFTGNTSPTDEQAQGHINSAAAPLLALGTLPTTLQPLATEVIALRAAASLARAFPRYERAVELARELEKQADADWKILLTLNVETGTDPGTALMPQWSFPAPVLYPGDFNL